jgi:hypothetical protein
MTPVAIDVGIGDTLRAINDILARRGSERATVWESLDAELRAVMRMVEDLDHMYLALLAEIEDTFAKLKPSPDRINDALHQATTYCTNESLTLHLVEARGEIQAAAFNRALKHRRYRYLASTLRSIDDPLGKYIDRLSRLQSDDTPKIPGQDDQWDLRTVIALLELVRTDAERGDTNKCLPDPKDACEEAIRNYNRALSLALATLIGHARQDLAMDRL